MINFIDLKEVFDFIENLKTYSHVKVGISNIIDEYYAAYYAQMKYYSTSNMFKGLIRICEDIRNKVADPLRIYLMLINVLAYAIAEDKVLVNKGMKSYYDETLLDESVNDFRHIFIEIKGVLISFNKSKFKTHIHKLEILLIELLKLMNVDFNFLKKLDEKYK
ncbi:MAG TPA: hypothetical protein PK304_02785 [Mobilitalea sp.]|nr:hypothetical protein [Mobilitalea sp.]